MLNLTTVIKFVDFNENSIQRYDLCIKLNERVLIHAYELKFAAMHLIGIYQQIVYFLSDSFI